MPKMYKKNIVYTVPCTVHCTLYCTVYTVWPKSYSEGRGGSGGGGDVGGGGGGGDVGGGGVMVAECWWRWRCHPL